ncbi:hypothetical protein IDR12_000386 [Salmonella enterica]|nr:hypothetical protein [Salmonella enterica]EKI3327474.1 hypothetical protein [Salmonella enterica]
MKKTLTTYQLRNKAKIIVFKAVNTLALSQTRCNIIAMQDNNNGANIKNRSCSTKSQTAKPEEVFTMKKLTILFCCVPIVLFSCFTCAMTPDNTSAIIRKNAQNTESHPTLSVAENTPYIIVPDENNQIIIPAGKILIMPEKDAKKIITLVVNYTDIREAKRITKVSDGFILE